jgi:hypothetical protein
MVTPTITTGLLDTVVTENNNLLQPTGFKILINRKKFPNVEFFATSVIHPAMVASPVEQSFRRVTSVPFAADKITFSEVTIEILLDENLTAYKEIYNWMLYLISVNDITPTRATDERPATYADITVKILNSHNNVTNTITYYDCIPVSLGDVPLLSTTGDIQYINCPISFRFSQFEIS